MTNADTSHAGTQGIRFGAPLKPGRRDGLGERWSTVLTADGSHVELLELRAEAATAPGFEAALRDQIAQLKSFKDPAFATVRELYRDGEILTIVSALVPGQRLSELTPRDVPKARRPALVARLLQQATPALAALERVAPGVTHGALTTDRILVTPRGGICITDYVFGSALHGLALWPEDLFLQFGLLAPAQEDGQAAFDTRTTVMQLGAVALSLLLERPVSLQDFDHGLDALIDEFVTKASAVSTPSALITPLRTWLEAALQVSAPGYASAADAEKGLTQALAAAGAAATMEIDASQVSIAQPRLVGPAPDEQRAIDRNAVKAAALPHPTADAGDVATLFTTERTPAPIRPPLRAAPQYFAWLAAALAAIAIGEGAVILWLMKNQSAQVQPSLTIESTQPGTTVMVDGRTVGAAPVTLQVTEQTRAIRIVPAEPIATSAAAVVPAPAVPAETNRTAAALEQAAARQRSGGVTFVSPIQLSVLEGDRVLGSTSDGTIVAGAGAHTLDLVNTALGFRMRQIVTIRSGVIARVPITPPMGRISINAQPWAQVLIDDTAIGETPLANVPATLGEHLITFRHPQFGERRERVVVRADAPARVSTTFQR